MAGPYRFRSMPLPGTPPTRGLTMTLRSGKDRSTSGYRVWVVGDAGTGNSRQRAVAKQYQDLSGDPRATTDVWLMLGDNAYLEGTDDQFQTAMFNVFGPLMASVPAWSAFGNHEGGASSSPNQSGPYYSIFGMPVRGESGVGTASGTAAYYSFTHGIAHFVVLNSFDINNSPRGPMMTWAQSDIRAARASGKVKWVVAVFHHPPYSWGIDPPDRVAMRENALPILEAEGVDIVLSGHIHTYERSVLLDSHYGPPSSYKARCHAKDSGTGSVVDPYNKPPGVSSHGGTVYIVLGSSGTVDQTGASVGAEIPEMVTTKAVMGSLVMDVSETELVGQFVDERGAVQDEFMVRKSADWATHQQPARC